MMKTATSQLVFGEDRPDQMIMETGRLPDGWLQRYLSALNSDLDSCGLDYWPRSFVRATHWASFYLPIRYHAAARFGLGNVNTLRELRSITVETEKRLFADLFRSQTPATMIALSDGDHCKDVHSRLIYLAFGQGNPVTTSEAGESLELWRNNFIEAWTNMTTTLRATKLWNKWPVMAARFASFYWDIWLTQFVQLEANPVSMIDDCRCPEFPLPTLAIMNLVLGSNLVEVGDTGLPILGPPSTNARHSVRRIVEGLLSDNLE